MDLPAPMPPVRPDRQHGADSILPPTPPPPIVRRAPVTRIEPRYPAGRPTHERILPRHSARRRSGLGRLPRRHRSTAPAVDPATEVDGQSAAGGDPVVGGEPPAEGAALPATPTRRSRPEAVDVAVWLFLAAISYIPSFFSQPGRVAADTKDYLYLDPGRLIQSAISAWDPDFGAGTVTHENIGFLFPMGPYYWLVAELHIPMWIGQRFWMGSLFFAAGTGVWYLGRLLGLTRSGRLAAALAYMLTPYVLDYIARISGIVMPWAALGWMMALTILAVRKGGWRYPALFAVVIALVGGVNATSILLVGAGPPAVGGLRRLGDPRGPVPGRPGRRGATRASSSLGVSVWWMAGFWAEGAYGLNVLKYTETVPTVSSTSLSSEVFRGLGYWYFYGTDKLGPWTAASVGYLQWTWLIAVSFLVPTLCVAAGTGGAVALPRLRHRPDRGGRRLGRGHLPLQGPHALRRPDQGRRSGLHGRTGLALHQPDRPAGPAGPGPPARRRASPPSPCAGRWARHGRAGPGLRPDRRRSPAPVGRGPGGHEP